MATALVPAEITAPVTREQSEKAAARLLTLQQMEKELAARLKEWVKAPPDKISNYHQKCF